MRDQGPGAFEKAVSDRATESVVSDLWRFFRTTRKWWMLPIIVALLLFGVLMLIGGTAAAPFIYTLF